MINMNKYTFLFLFYFKILKFLFLMLKLVRLNYFKNFNFNQLKKHIMSTDQTANENNKRPIEQVSIDNGDSVDKDDKQVNSNSSSVNNVSKKPKKSSRSRSDKTEAIKKRDINLNNNERKTFTKQWAGLPSRETVSQLPNDGPKLPKRKCALLIGFCGTGYNGMQIQPHENVKTIEGEIFIAMIKAGVISKDNSTDPGKVNLQRAARTDTGVHAAMNLLSIKMIVDLPDNRDVVDCINEHLPPHIRIWGYVRTQNSFDARTSCDSRSYEYLLPSHVFLPPAPWTNMGKKLNISHPFWDKCNETDSWSEVMEKKRNWRIDDERLVKLENVLKKFTGSHNFWVYTIGKTYQERSSQRFMKEIKINEKLEVENNEWISIRFYGQSFMLHQIRKMIFMIVNVVRTNTSIDLIERTFSDKAIVVPKAPGLGLLLEQPYFNVYNNRMEENNNILEKQKQDRIAKALKKKEKDGDERDDELIKQESISQTENDKKPQINFEQHKNKVDVFKKEFIYKRIRDEEQKGNIFNRWISMIDAFEGDQLDYLNENGEITELSIKSGKKGFTNKGKEGEALDEF